MDILTISNIILWIGFISLALVTLALTRQVGILYERIAPAGALAINKKIEAGLPAPELSLQTLSSDLIQIGGVQSRSQLLFFISPDCPVCRTLLPALKSAVRAESDWIDLILASDGPEQDHGAYVKKYGLSNFPYVISEVLGKVYGVSKLPYAVLVDEKGKVASLGIINSREHLDSLFEAKERNIASIQDYLSNKSITP